MLNGKMTFAFPSSSSFTHTLLSGYRAEKAVEADIVVVRQSLTINCDDVRLEP